jgi:3-phenylpropionate/trans-cinnamate dioxygenase ferredoxin subunit
MAFVDVAAVDDIRTGAMKPFAVAGKEILIVNHYGSYYAIARRCPHLGGDLSKGTLDGTTVTCPRHHSRFDVTTGNCLSGPKIGPLKLSTKDTTGYQVRVEGQRIQVDL